MSRCSVSNLFRQFVAGIFLTAICATATAVEWPQEVVAEEGTIIVYQPQPESLDGNVLKGRAAMSLEIESLDEAIFGAFWFEARIDNDSAAGVAWIRDVKVTAVRWPQSRDADEQRFTAVVEAAVSAISPVVNDAVEALGEDRIRTALPSIRSLREAFED